MNRIFLILMLWAGCCLNGVAQTADDSVSKQSSESVDSVQTNQPPVEAQNQPPIVDGLQLTNNWFILSIVILILSFSFGIIFLLIRSKHGDPLESSEMIRMVSVILIVTCALLIPVIAGQLVTIPNVAAPLYSLLGTIAGYLLGKGNTTSSGSSNSETTGTTTRSTN